MQKPLLKLFFSIGFLLIPFAFKRKNLKDWLLVFFVKGYISSFIATIVVNNKQISYPVRFIPKFFRISVLFDYFLFPILCVFFNRTTLSSKPIHVVYQSLLYSLPMTILEIFLEKYTKLIRYKHNWNWIITYITLSITFLMVRLFMSIIRALHVEEEQIG
jgi:hypothetical protein